MAGEEKVGKRMKQDISRARIFTDRYIEGSGYGGSNDLGRYVSKYKEKARNVVAGAICSRLVEKITLKNYRILLKGLKSLEMYLEPDNMGDLEEKIMGICEEYECKMEQGYSKLHCELKLHLQSRLEVQGITGSSIEVNAEIFPKWNVMIDELDLEYNKLLNSIKEKFRPVQLPNHCADTI